MNYIHLDSQYSINCEFVSFGGANIVEAGKVDEIKYKKKWRVLETNIKNSRKNEIDLFFLIYYRIVFNLE